MPELDMRDLDAWAVAFWPTCSGYWGLGSVCQGLVRNAARHAQSIRAEAWQKGYDAGERCTWDAGELDHECYRNPYLEVRDA